MACSWFYVYLKWSYFVGISNGPIFSVCCSIILFTACSCTFFCCWHTVIRWAGHFHCLFSLCIMSSAALKALKSAGSDKRLTSKRIRARLHLLYHLNYTFLYHRCFDPLILHPLFGLWILGVFSTCGKIFIRQGVRL